MLLSFSKWGSDYHCPYSLLPEQRSRKTVALQPTLLAPRPFPRGLAGRPDAAGRALALHPFTPSFPYLRLRVRHARFAARLRAFFVSFFAM